MNSYSQYQSLKPENIIESEPATFHPSGRVTEAIAQMHQNYGLDNRRYSYILILEKSKLIGILTEKDIVRLTATGIDLATIKVEEVMTTEVITLKKSDFLNINMAMTIMRQNKIRHLPIVDDQGHLQGLVSAQTICRALHPSNLLKFRRVQEAMSSQVLEAPLNASILNLSKIMAESKQSCVVIVKKQTVARVADSTDSNIVERDFLNTLSIPVGIVTERDIVQFQILGLDLENTSAEAVMSTPLECLKNDDSLLLVRQQMEKLRVRRLVIVGEEGELQGVITQFHMLKVLDPEELFCVIETLQAELEEKTAQLQQEKELAQVTLRSIGDAVVTTDAVGKIVNFNPMAEKLTGWKFEEAKGKPLADILHLVNQYTRDPVINPVKKVLRENKVFGLANHTLLIARDGTEYAIEDSAAPIRNNQGQMIGAVMVFHDVTESRHLSNQLTWQANHDALTGLYNRREFEKQLLAAISLAQNEGHHHTLCYLDLDRFKIINDTCGHAAGDELLKQVTKLMLEQTRVSDILARLGGDEFGLLLNRCSLEKGIEIANYLRQLIDEFRFSWQGQTFSIGVSIGMIEITSDTESLSSLMNTADAACYMAKANGRNCIHVHQENDVELAKNLGEREWIGRLNQALEENYFRLYSQRIISIDEQLMKDPTSGIGLANRYEILLRLHDSQGQIISPGAFIPAAERYDLMPAIDRWVIENFSIIYNNYCKDTKNKNNSACKNIYAINLSGASINSRQFRHFLIGQFTSCVIAPENICFEITETTAISNLVSAAEFIQELRQLGCSIALDDFGSGMSSLTYLENLKVDYLKIDGSFVQKIVGNQIARATVKYFNQIAQIMNIKTIAEFVENEAILRQLKNIGVNYAQGYEIARPTPLTF